MRILLASHGTLAQGIYSALKIIVGNVENVDYLNAYVEGVDFKKDCEEYFEQHKDEQLLVCTDLFGGSVNQAIMQKLKERSFILVTGMNLPLLLELSIAANNSDLDENKVREIINNTKEQQMLVNDILNVKVEDDFDL